MRHSNHPTLQSPYKSERLSPRTEARRRRNCHHRSIQYNLFPTRHRRQPCAGQPFRIKQSNKRTWNVVNGEIYGRLVVEGMYRNFATRHRNIWSPTMLEGSKTRYLIARAFGTFETMSVLRNIRPTHKPEVEKRCDGAN